MAVSSSQRILVIMSAPGALSHCRTAAKADNIVS